MHCFYIEPPVDGVAALPKDEAKHAAKVLRLRPGDPVCAMDGAGGRWDAVIESVGDGVTVRLYNDREAASVSHDGGVARLVCLALAGRFKSADLMLLNTRTYLFEKSVVSSSQ